MKNSLARYAAYLAALLMLAGCVVYDPYYPYPQPQPGPSAYERSWNSAVGAMQDEGVQVTVAERATGRIQGRAGEVSVNTHVFTQADGRVRIEFNAVGPGHEALVGRISSAYERRMGR
jgi:hypothetical protein